jgi:lipoate-protein ligase A
MKYLELTLPTVAENLALDEALLDCVADVGDVLRFWEADRPAVIVGRASRVTDEVNQQECVRAGIPILRRCSGGAAVVLGPGCLTYSVILSTAGRPELQIVNLVHRFVLGRLQQALQQLDFSVQLSGTSDLTLDGRKFSGNSLRVRRDALLYHGTLLYDADISQISACLIMPPRQPAYRQQRSHQQFLTNVPVTPAALRHALREVWACPHPLVSWPRSSIDRLVRERYGCPDWNFAR